MADILSRSLSFVRYYVDEIAKDIDIPAKLKQFGFMPIDNICNEYSFGWSNFDDYLDIDWHISPPEKGEYICFSLRYDQRKIAPAVFKKEFKLALDEEYRRLAEQGWKFISKDRKKEIKENTRFGLLSKTLPTPSWSQAVWNTQTNEILFFSTSKVMNAIFADLYHRTFGVVLNQHQETVFKKIYEAEPVGEEIAAHDFLTWLWYRSDFGIHVLGEETIGKAGKTTLTDTEKSDRCAVSGSPDVLEDAFASMQHGKTVKKAQFTLPNDVLFELDADEPSKIGLKNLPKSLPLEDGDDPDAPILERIEQIEEAIENIDRAFDAYIAVMSDAEHWKQERIEIARWIKSDE